MSMTTTDPGADKAVQALPELRGDGFWEERMKTIQAECGAPDTPEVWHALWRVRDELERWAISYAREAQRAALTHRQQGVVGQWQPIKTAPADRLVVVGWIDSEDAERPERQDFDYLEDDCWTKWHDYAEHVHMIGGHGVIDAPPYTHWFGLPAIPKASAPALTASPPAQIKHETSEDEVICPNCSHQFRAIPPSVQRLMLDAGFEPPFTAPPAQPQSEPCAWCCGTGRFADHACRFCAGKAAGSVFAAQPPERAAQQRADYVPMPTSADEAAMMCLIGEAWLRENAPERLRAAQQEPNVMVRRAEGVAST